MGVCETCGNHYEKTFQIRLGTETHVFDSFECAISALAPTCAHCHCRILGHGIEDRNKNTIYCCGHCARKAGSDPESLAC